MGFRNGHGRRRLGVVSFLNARPLIEGLRESAGVEIVFDVPARLPARLDAGEVDAALIPIFDIFRSPGRYRIVSDACIGCDGETMTVRVFSQVPPDRIQTIWADLDSHTSVNLARVLWQEMYGREVEVRPFDARRQRPDEVESVLLIGDKVVDPRRGSFAYEIDLGGAWRQHTGLPFVFAVWACRAGGGSPPVQGTEEHGELAGLLKAARDHGVARAAEIAETQGPELGWPTELARRYLTRCLTYKVDARAVEGAEFFARLCARAKLVAEGSGIPWTGELLACGS